MSIIYETKCRAREYCEMALNLYKECTHGCTYCIVRQSYGLHRIYFYPSIPPDHFIKLSQMTEGEFQKKLQKLKLVINTVNADIARLRI